MFSYDCKTGGGGNQEPTPEPHSPSAADLDAVAEEQRIKEQHD